MVSSVSRAQDRMNRVGGLSPRTELVLLIIILAVAAGLRLGMPGLTEFKADEAHLTALALDLVEDKKFPIRGISSSVGFPNFPMSVWLYAIPLFIWKNVLAATLFTGLLNLAAVLGCYWFARRYWGAEAALAAALMFAVSPWAVHHSRKIWAQNLLPVFVTGWGISGVMAMIERRSRFIILHFLCLAIAFQVHLAGIALIPATLILLIIFRRHLNWRHALMGGLLAALSTLPFVYYLINSGGVVGSKLTSGFDTARGLDGLALRYTALLSSGREIHALTGAEMFDEFLETVPDISVVHWFWGAQILAGILWLAWRTPLVSREEELASDAGVLVLVWIFTPILLFSLPQLPVFLHYLLPVFPAQYIAAGAVFGWLACRRGGLWRGVGWILLSGSALAQVWVWVGLLTFAAERATPGGLGVPLAFQQRAAALAKKMMLEEGAAEVLIAGDGESVETDAFPAIYSVLLRSVPHRFVDVARSAVFPESGTVVLLDPAAGRGAELYQAAAAREERVALRQGEGMLQILALPEGSAPVPEAIFDPPQILTNWAAFWGYDLPVTRGSDTAIWRVYWYAGGPTPVDYHMFNHLIDSRGMMVSQMDAPVFAPNQWHERDVVVSHFELSWPAVANQPLTLRTGMYSYPDLENVLIFDVAGNPYTDAIELTLK